MSFIIQSRNHFSSLCIRHRLLFNDHSPLLHCVFKPRNCSTQASATSKTPTPEISLKHDHSPASSPNTEIIYRGYQTRLVRRIKYFSLGTTVIGMSVQPFLLNGLIASTSTGSKIAYSAAVATAACVILSPILFNILTKRYVTEILYDRQQDTFVACTLSFFNRKKYTTFKTEHVKVPPVLGPFTSFLVKGKPYLVDPFAFTHLSYYKRLTGLDKVPIVPLQDLEDAIRHKSTVGQDKHSKQEGKHKTS